MNKVTRALILSHEGLLDEGLKEAVRIMVESGKEAQSILNNLKTKSNLMDLDESLPFKVITSTLEATTDLRDWMVKYHSSMLSDELVELYQRTRADNLELVRLGKELF